MKKLFAFTILALAFLAACGSSGAPTEYNETVRDNYMDGCTNEGDPPGAGQINNLESICRCSYRQIERDIAFNQFEILNESLLEDINRLSVRETNDPVFRDVQRIIRDCIQECSGSGIATLCQPFPGPS